MVKYLKQLKLRQRAIWGLILGILVLSPGGWIYASTLFEDNFDSYDNGDLTGQGDWVQTDSSWLVQDTVKHGVKAIFCDTGITCGNKKTGEQTPTGSIGLFFRIEKIGDNCSQGWFNFYGDPNGTARFYFTWGGTGCKIYFTSDEGQVEIGTIDTYDTWFPVDFEWRDGTHDVRMKWEGKDWTPWRVAYKDWTYIDTIGLRKADLDAWIDTIGETATLPPVRVFGVSPASETTITDLETNFTLGWEFLDDWDSLSILFQNKDTGIFSSAKLLETVSPSGQETFAFKDFDFDRSGKYYFYAVATRLGIEVIEGMYLTGKYSYQWSDDLVSPDYWFLIDVEELTPFFGMTGFEEWYSEISKFATPTDMFVSIAGFFQPIFNKIGEFGNRIKDYFNVSEAYSQGYEIGKTISYFSYFVGQISLFLGGFPILKWVFVVILLLTGIFIFRLVMKFIPFLGGS